MHNPLASINGVVSSQDCRCKLNNTPAKGKPPVISSDPLAIKALDRVDVLRGARGLQLKRGGDEVYDGYISWGNTPAVTPWRWAQSSPPQTSLDG